MFWYYLVGENDDAYGKLDIGFGTDEKAVILVLGHRNAQQRNEIKETYQQLYNESLIDRLHSELSGDFRVCHGFCTWLDFCFLSAFKKVVLHDCVLYFYWHM